MDQVITHDVIILGTGLAGLRAAVELSIRTGGKVDIGVISKVQIMRSHSVCAEGGTSAVMRPEEGGQSGASRLGYDQGHRFPCRPGCGRTFCPSDARRNSAPRALGVPWSRREDGRIMQRPFGGHSSHPFLSRQTKRAAIVRLHSISPFGVSAEAISCFRAPWRI